jgi:hypothetical protein
MKSPFPGGACVGEARFGMENLCFMSVSRPDLRASLATFLASRRIGTKGGTTIDLHFLYV